MTIFDPKFTEHKKEYLFQTLLVVMVITVIMMLVDAPSNSALVASIGSTAFIVFAMPHRNVSKERYIIWGYLLSFVVGVGGRLIVLALTSTTPLSSTALICLGSGFAVGLSTLSMVITNSEHPPAAGFALGIVLNGLQEGALLVVVGCLALVIVSRRMLRRILVDLL